MGRHGTTRHDTSLDFDVYKMLEPDMQASTIGYGGRDAALEEIESARRRAKEDV